MSTTTSKKDMTRREAITLGIAAPLALVIPQSMAGVAHGLNAVSMMNWDAFKLWLKSLLGDTDAMGDLALAYEWGEGVPESERHAVYWMKRAADLGCPFALRWMSVRYEHGWGVSRNRRRALVLLQQAAEEGDWEAKLYLAGRYFEGDGVPQTDDVALEWVRRSVIYPGMEHAVIIHPAVEPHLKRLGITAMEFG